MDSGVCELWCVWTREYGLSSLYGFGVYGLYCVDSGVYGSGVCSDVGKLGCAWSLVFMDFVCELWCVWTREYEL